MMVQSMGRWQEQSRYVLPQRALQQAALADQQPSPCRCSPLPAVALRQPLPARVAQRGMPVDSYLSPPQ